MTSSTRRDTRDRLDRDRRDWLVPALLILLTLVPMLGGAVRVGQVAGGAVTPENARFLAAPLPVLLHIFSASLYCVFGALQFAPGLRRRGRAWHRVSGRLLVPLGLVAALAGLWMTVFYPHGAGGSVLLDGLRLFFGTAMVGSIVLGFVAVRRRNFAAHRAWMIRGYAIGLGAGTQVLTGLPWILLVGPPVGVTNAVLLAAGWVINVAVAEWVIRRRPVRRPRRAPVSGAVVLSGG